MRGNFRLNPFLQLPICDESYNESLHGCIPCDSFRRKIIALRVYFILVIINFLFITSTTIYFIYRYKLAKEQSTPSDKELTTVHDISRQWQSYSLRKRGLFGTVLGAIGHLIVSTAVLIYQVIVTNFTCDIYLWAPVVGFYVWTYGIIWRTYSLHRSIQINELRHKFSKTKSIKYNNREACKNKPKYGASLSKRDKEYKYFMKTKDSLKMGMKNQILYVCASLVVISLIITLAEALGIWKNGFSTCEFYMGNYMMITMIAFFFALIVPFIFYYLRNDGDAHGIRREIWITMAVTVPCFIMCIVWQVAFEYPSDINPANIRGVFGPSNWLIIVTTTYHVLTVVLPVFRKLSIDTTKMTRNCEKPCRHRKSSALSNITISRVLQHKHRNNSSISLQDHFFNSNHHWELTVESLSTALRNPATLNVLQCWAVKDFSVENILFYNRYLQLVEQVHGSYHFVTDKSVELEKLAHPQDLVDSSSEDSYKGFDVETSKVSIINEVALDIPLGLDQIPDLIDIYNTFITDESPFQVNISHKARSEIDAALAPLVKKLGNNVKTQTYQPGIPQFLQPSIILEGSSIESNSNFLNRKATIDSPQVYQSYASTLNLNNVDESELYSLKNGSVSIDTNMSLQVLEAARKEVFWNIFTGLYPKVVEAYNNICIY